MLLYLEPVDEYNGSFPKYMCDERSKKVVRRIVES